MRLSTVSWVFCSISALLWLAVPVAAGPPELPSPEVFDSITQSCRERMARNVIAPQAASAYCYCYADWVTQRLSQADFERMGRDGPADRDRRVFRAAHQRCANPAKR